MTPQQMRDVLADIRYKHGYMFVLRPLDPVVPDGFKGTFIPSAGARYYLQVHASIPFPPPMRGSKLWKGRKWALSEHMTVSELVLTAFKALLTFEEHECREAFTFRGQKVCGPHINIEQLAALMASEQLQEQERA